MIGKRRNTYKVKEESLKKVRMALKKRGLSSQQVLAELLGIGRSTVTNFLGGKKPIEFSNFELICKELNLDWRDVALLEEEESSQRSDREKDELNTADSDVECPNVGINASQYKKYGELLEKIALWNPSNPDSFKLDRLYDESESLQIAVESNDKLEYYAVCLKYYLLCKAGRIYRQQKHWNDSEQLYKMNYLIRHQPQRPETAIAHWILARIYFSEAEDIGSSQAANANARKNLEYICGLMSKITEEIKTDLPILLPGIKSEYPEDKLELVPDTDPITRVIPVPYRYQSTYSLCLFGIYKILGWYKELQDLLGKAQGYCKKSIDKYGSKADNSLLWIDIRIDKVMCNIFRLNQGLSEKNDAKLADYELDKLEFQIEECEKLGFISRMKAVGFLTVIYAGRFYLHQLGKSKECEKSEQEYRKMVVKLIEMSSGQMGFLWIEPIHKLPFNNDLNRFRKFMVEVQNEVRQLSI